MAKNYKLSEEIERFIIKQKKTDQKLSCRGFVLLIKEKFQVNISKSLINSVLKKENLSSSVGRTRIKELVISMPVQTPRLPKQKTPSRIEIMDNGGFLFLKAADLASGLTLSQAEKLSPYFPNLSIEILQEMLQIAMYLPFFKNKKPLWLLISKEICLESLTQYSQALVEASEAQIQEEFLKVGFNLNFNKIKELHNQCLISLNSYSQTKFFPNVYQILDFSAMRERFYSLSARIVPVYRDPTKAGEDKPNLCKIQLFCAPDFHWQNDVVWQEDISYAVNMVNNSQIFTPKKTQVWMSAELQLQIPGADRTV